ncbi:hypothetical protein Pcinc_028725 [Petrolisthes cinctipes]|uniref:Methyltransferase domain-containing protein n=1 Tax=Petrolisthes cinctipes TaxID=88211 RepID=A0AAE1F335_PETCI|nr:hypothetical protein Pcinc_028725 [Petrolisthes cinctipes]
MASKMHRNNYFFLILGFISAGFLFYLCWTQSYTTIGATSSAARKTRPLSNLSKLDLGSEGDVTTPAEGGVPVPAEGGVPAPAEGGVPAPAEGDVPAPEGIIIGPARDGRVGLSCHQPVTTDGRFYKEVDFAKDDEDWEKKSCSPVLTLPDPDEFYNYVETPRLQCEIPVMVGGKRRSTVIDGNKWVCMSKKFKVQPDKCVVMSFGISTDWSFDDEMDKKYGCKVYSFDHTIHKQDHERSKNLKFYSLGLSGTTRTNKKGIVTIDRYINTLKKLNLENSTIDYLKIDIEGSELSFFGDVLYQTPNLMKNVKMMGIEIHMTKKDHLQRFWEFFQRLECLGFKVIFTEMNRVKSNWFHQGKKLRSMCYEVVWARDRQW